MFRFLFFFSLLISVLPHTSTAQSPSLEKQTEQNSNPLPLPLKQYLEHIYKTHHAIRYMKSREDVLNESVASARMGLRPQITAQGYAGRVNTDTQTEKFNTDAQMHEISVSQPIYTGGRVNADTKVATARLKEGQARIQSDINTFLFEATEAYTSYYENKYLVALYEKTVADAEKRVTSVTAEKKAGERTVTDLALADSKLATAKADLNRTQADLSGARMQFIYYIGEDNLSKFENTQDNPLEATYDFTPPDLAEFYRLNPSILEANQGANAASFEIASAENKYSPSLNLDGRAVINDRRDEIGREIKSNDLSLLARYTIPLYSRGLEYSNSRRAIAEESRARNRLIAISGDSASTYKTNILKYNASQSVVSSYETALKSSHIAADATAKEYRYGFKSITDLLDAERDVVKTSADLIKAKSERLKNLIALLRDINRLR